jgi:hypothetical protein
MWCRNKKIKRAIATRNFMISYYESYCSRYHGMDCIMDKHFSDLISWEKRYKDRLLKLLK